MVDAKTVVVSVVAVLSVFLQPGIRAQPTIDSSNEEDSCSQLKEGREIQAEENMRLRGELESERQRIKTLENVTKAQSEENQKLKLVNERRQLRLQRVTKTLLHRFDVSRTIHGITKVEDWIYVLCLRLIKVYEDRNNFRFIKDIQLNGTVKPSDIVYSNKSKYVYIIDDYLLCIWAMTTTGEHRLTKWLTDITAPYTLSLSNEGHLLVLKEDLYQLEIYSLNATLSRRFQLPRDYRELRHVVQTWDGNFNIIHKLNISSSPTWVISQLTNDGHLIHRFLPRNESEELQNAHYLSLDSANERLFVADYWSKQVILFDSIDLTWSQALAFEEISGFEYPQTIFYDTCKEYLFVVHNNWNLSVFNINFKSC